MSTIDVAGAPPPAGPRPPGAYVGRFAPSPTGPLHAGSLLAAFGSWLAARHEGGSWLVRIEDLDPPRTVAGAAEAQLRTLAAHGLLPTSAVVRQSGRGCLYQAALDRLLQSGAAFTCHCSRSDVAAVGGVHRSCRPGAGRTDPAVRLRVPADTWIEVVDAVHGRIVQDVSRAVGDFVLRRADGHWAYQLAVVVDDAAQGVTEVVRGADLLDSTPRQVLLQRALALPTPAYLHLPLVVDASGHKLSKSDGSGPLDDRAPLAALGAAWHRLGQPAAALPRTGTLAEVLAAAAIAFDRARIPRTPASILAAAHNPFLASGE